jgi:hypothetical protein
MKKFTVYAATFILILISSCKHSDTAAGGNWTFQGTSYTATSCGFTGGTLNATNADFANTANGTAAELQVQFYNGTPPTIGGTFHVGTGYPANSGYVVIYAFTMSGNNKYISTGSDNKSVAITITNGKLAVAGSNIEMVNSSLASDTTPITFNITQL